MNPVLAALRSASPQELADLCRSPVFRAFVRYCYGDRPLDDLDDDDDDDDAEFDAAELGIPPE